MSALRNAVKRKTHKERSQPGERRKFGLLEKKKDYVLRARDFHKKEDAIKVLKTKAAYKNPDEFYFGMQRSRTRDGVHVGRADESNKYTAEELALMKTQDVKYVGLKASVEAKKAEKLRANLHLIGEDESHDEDDLYDWYTWPRAVHVLRHDPRALAALRTLACGIAAAVSAGRLPSKWGGFFGQEWPGAAIAPPPPSFICFFRQATSSSNSISPEPSGSASSISC